jgi:threonine dehydrogenase-like Zn-dependent dehydrogenase
MVHKVLAWSWTDWSTTGTAKEETMLEATPIQAQLADARGDPLRVLVVGAGVAGLTVAQLLRAQGLHPVLVEGRRARPAAATCWP